MAEGRGQERTEGDTYDPDEWQFYRIMARQLARMANEEKNKEAPEPPTGSEAEDGNG